MLGQPGRPNPPSATAVSASNALAAPSPSSAPSARASATTSTGAGSSAPSLLPRSSASAASSPLSGTSTPNVARMAANNNSNGNNATYSSTMSPRRASSSLAAPSHSATSSAGRRINQHHSAAAALSTTDGSNAVPSLYAAYPTGPHSSANPQRSTQQTGHHHSLYDSLRGSIGGVSTASPRMSSHGLPAYMQQARGFPPWDTSAARGAYQLLSTSQQDASSSRSQPVFEENTLVSFSWTIRDLHLLRDEVERTPSPSMGGRSVSAGAGRSQVWTTQPLFGEGKWRLELVRTRRQITEADATGPSAPAEVIEASETPSQPPAAADNDAGMLETMDDDAERHDPRTEGLKVLSVYLTSVVLDYSHSDVEIPASIMIGIRPAREPIGRRGSSSGGWCWREFYHWNFRREAEFFECHDLPSISDLLLDDMIRRDDALTLTVQLGLGPAHASRTAPAEDTSFMPPFETKGVHLVPRSVLDSLHGLLDDANTGDVRIVIRERGFRAVGADIPALYPVGSVLHDEDDLEPWQSTDKICVRDRVLWAHSSILKNRSDYFSTMLASSFSEGVEQSFLGRGLHRRGPSNDGEGSAGSRQVRTIRIPNADFNTTYWFLRFLYTEEILFADSEDVRSAMLDEDWATGADEALNEWRASAAISQGHRFLETWTPLSELLVDDDDAQHGLPEQQQQHPNQARSTKQANQSALYSSYAGTFPRMQHHSGHSCTLNTRASDGMLAASPTRSGAMETTPPSPSMHLGSSSSGGSQQHQHQQQQQQQTVSSPASGQGQGTPSSSPFISDPHEHPTDPPGKASALAIFRLAHRYEIRDLSAVAAAHLVSSLTPATAFPLLLATSVYVDLHEKVKRFVYEHWESVASSSAFERGCEQVGAGEWGPEAGKALRLFMMSLVSPARVVPVAQGRT